MGDGTTTARSWPALINGAAGIAALASGYESAYLVRSDGAVFAVGYNTDGELGNGTTNSSSTTSLVQAYLGGSQLTLTSSANPAQVGAAVTLTATLTGSSPTGTVTFKDGATVLATVPLSAGSAAYSTNSLTEGVHRITAEYSGDTVNNPEGAALLVQAVGSFGLAQKVSAGPWAYHALAVKTDGSLLAWGWNQYGQLGDGTTANRAKAVKVDGISAVSGAAASARGSVVVKSDGTVWGWGDLVGDSSVRPVPAQVVGLAGVTAVAAGQNHALARKSDGTVWTWGANGNGQLGNNSTTNSALPVQVSGLSGVVAVTAGESSSFALKSDGTVWAWGNNGNGQLGDNSTTQRLVPVQVTGLSGVSAIAAGRYHVAALKTDGTVWAWGYNCDGQLGNEIGRAHV